MKRKTLKAFVEQTSNPKLARAVVRQLGGWESAQESLPDIARHGVDGGFHGFIYYHDTNNFFKANRKEILKCLDESTLGTGESPFRMVTKWEGLEGFDEFEIAAGIYDTAHEHATLVRNALAWFAAEEVAHWYDDWTRD